MEFFENLLVLDSRLEICHKRDQYKKNYCFLERDKLSNYKSDQNIFFLFKHSTIDNRIYK